jgi:putative NADH-flavin reductase
MQADIQSRILLQKLYRLGKPGSGYHYFHRRFDAFQLRFDVSLVGRMGTVHIITPNNQTGCLRFPLQLFAIFVVYVFMSTIKNILILGITGRTGKEVLRYALSKGYHVSALVRDPEKTGINPAGLTLVKGSPLHVNDLRAMDGFEAIISTLGHSDLKPSTLMTDSIRNAITVMKERKAFRIVVQTGAGAGDSFGMMPESIQAAIRETELKSVYDDHNGQEQVVMNSGLNWTLVRPVTLNDGEEGEHITQEHKISESATISRKTAAKFLIDCLEAKEFFHKAIVISQVK